MTDLAFHFNAPHKVQYACKLLRKATGAGARVAVLAPPELLARLDAALWSFSPVDFIAHVRAPCAPEVQARTSVVLCEDAQQVQGYGVLVNLTTGVPQGFERFERVIEVVDQGDADRQTARLRWKHYTELGYQITRHDLQLSP